MRRVIAPLMLAVAFAAFTSANASAGLFGLCKSHCDVGPVCGCEAPAPACGCEIAVPACGCEAPCGCDSHCGVKRPGLLTKLFAKRSHCCDAPCAPAPVCGCEVVAPSCGFEAPCCDSGCSHIKRPGLLSKLFSKKSHCCEAPAPTCGCEPTCGF
ncbi:MAG: keratin-like protein [Planctomycetaceae bacterium]|nr:MAG: keratin-like protein [Planctomycetaceae bacterium]